MTQIKIASRALPTMMGLVATLIMLADISVAQNRFFLGVGYVPGSGEDKITLSLPTASSNGTIDIVSTDVSFTLGLRRVFPEQDFEADFSLHRIGMAEINTQDITGTGTSFSSTDKYDITEAGATNGVGANFRSTRAEGIHAQGGLEYHTGSSDTVDKNTSYVSTSGDNTTIGTTANGLITPDDKSSTDHSRLVLSLGPVFVPAGSSLQHGLLFTSISEVSETNDPPEGTSTVIRTTEEEITTGMISYTFRTLGEGNAYFGQIGFGSSEYVLVERYTGYSNVAENSTIEVKGDGSLFLLNTGVLINDVHEITLEVLNSALTSSERTYTQGTNPSPLASFKGERNRSTVELAYRYLF